MRRSSVTSKLLSAIVLLVLCACAQQPVIVQCPAYPALPESMRISKEEAASFQTELDAILAPASIDSSPAPTGSRSSASTRKNEPTSSPR